MTGREKWKISPLCHDVLFSDIGDRARQDKGTAAGRDSRAGRTWAAIGGQQDGRTGRTNSPFPSIPLFLFNGKNTHSTAGQAQRHDTRRYCAMCTNCTKTAWTHKILFVHSVELYNDCIICACNCAPLPLKWYMDSTNYPPGHTPGIMARAANKTA